jgi:DNA-binding NarL/FixJ family response regulator
MTIRVLLVDDHDIVRVGLRSILEHESNIEVVGDVGDGREALRSVRDLLPQIVLMDITMPHLNGLEATRQIVAQCPGTKVIGLSMHSDRQFVIEILKAGASGYLMKNSVSSELQLAIRAVAAGKVYLSPTIADVVLEDYLRHVPQQPRSALESLSPREREVLQLLAEGMTSKEIAQSLHVTQKTVESHRAQIMERLKLHTVAELTKFAIRQGLTSLES